MATPINTIYSWFETGDFPTRAQFQASWSSFWHKDETIPMTTIDGLSDQFGKYVLGSTFQSHLNDQNAHSHLAKKDASNLSPTNINDWRTKLGVEDLPDNVATYDYDLPDHVMMKDGTTKEAGDLGKNIANSSLTSVAGAGMTLGAPYVWNTANQPFSITGLPDKSADSTFSKIKVQNSQGQEAIVDNPYHIFKSGINTMTVPQTLEIAQLLNGGSGSAGAMSVNLISPPVIQKIDSNEYIMLRGVNLNLNATSKKMEILDATTKAVIVQIPDSQIQIYTDGLSLIFYYNFKDFGFGDFVIRLTSGVKVYDTTLTLSVLANVNNVNFNALLWESNIAEGVTMPPEMNVSQGGGSIYLSGSPSITTAPIITFKSSELFAQGEDFYLEMNITAGHNAGGLNGVSDISPKFNIGIGYETTLNSLLDNTLIKTTIGHYESIGVDVFNNSQNVFHGIGPFSYTVIFIKTGNLFRTIIGSSNQSVILSNNSGYSIFLNLCRMKSNFNAQFSIIKAYTFN